MNQDLDAEELHAVVTEFKRAWKKANGKGKAITLPNPNKRLALSYRVKSTPLRKRDTAALKGVPKIQQFFSSWLDNHLSTKSFG